MAEKMTITRGLRELKLLDERITKTITEITFVDCFQGRVPNMALATRKQKTEFEAHTKEKMQSVKDLSDRRTKIKSAIMKSNSETTVKIAGKEYFVIDAIEKKAAIKYDKFLLKRMRENFTHIKKQMDENKADLEKRIESMINSTLGTEKKIDEKTYNQIANPVLDANELKIIDPIGIEKAIEKLDNEIAEFESEVDFTLSESNSKTEIEI